MRELFSFISYLLTLYVYILIAAAVMSWLIAFNIVNPHNQVVRMIGEFLYRITEPVLRPIRNLLPNLGGIDISPVIVILIIIFVQNVVLPNLYRALATYPGFPEAGAGGCALASQPGERGGHAHNQ